MSYVYTGPPATMTTTATGTGPSFMWPSTTTLEYRDPAQTKALRPPDHGDVRDGVMLALFPDPANAADMVLPGGTEAAELHLTVAYLGKTTDVDPAALQDAAQRVAASAGPIGGLVSGHARFTGGDDGDVLVALFDSPALETLRRMVCEALDYAGIELPRAHGYTPHLTLGYLDVADAAPITRVASRPLTFTTLSVVYGPDRLDLPLSGAQTYRPGMDHKAADVGDFVVAGDRIGRVDLLITAGQVPAATPLGDGEAVTGTKEAPAARVVEYQPAGDGTWAATGTRFSCPADALARTAPLRTRQVKSLGEALSWAQASYPQAGTQPQLPAQTLMTVYERGVKSWPGTAATTLSAGQWGLGRVDAFAATWYGLRPAGYAGDDDLLPG